LHTAQNFKSDFTMTQHKGDCCNPMN